MLALAKSWKEEPKSKEGIQRETQTHKNGVRKVEAPTKVGLVSHDQDNEKAH